MTLSLSNLLFNMFLIRFAGVRNGTCFCGDELAGNWTVVGKENCDLRCPGYSDSDPYQQVFCGGVDGEIAVYKTLGNVVILYTNHLNMNYVWRFDDGKLALQRILYDGHCLNFKEFSFAEFKTTAKQFAGSEKLVQTEAWFC